MEATEVRSDDHENAERFVGVLDLWQEASFKAERDGDLGWLIEVGLQDVSTSVEVKNKL